jgi:mevalonate pyrophosphate decarboxylase
MATQLLLHAVSASVSDKCSDMADTALPLLTEHVCVCARLGSESVCRLYSALDRVEVCVRLHLDHNSL